MTRGMEAAMAACFSSRIGRIWVKARAATEDPFRNVLSSALSAADPGRL